MQPLADGLRCAGVGRLCDCPHPSYQTSRPRAKRAVKILPGSSVSSTLGIFTPARLPNPASEELLKQGAVVYMAGRSREKVAAAVGQLSAYGDRARPLVMDVTKQEEVQKGIEDTAAEAGRLDLLFNNAGVGGTIPFEKATLEDWKTIVDTNIWSVVYGVHAAVPIMLKQGSRGMS